jgi:hypothetical protein
MRPTPFAQVLDETIAAFAVADAAAPRRTFTPAPVLGFFDFSAGPIERGRVAPLGPYATAAPASKPPTARVAPIAGSPRPRSAGASSRPARTLSFRQRVAFEQLLNLGASIAPDFTRDELRHAFRELAHRYHPDRHQETPTDEQARLGDLFRRAHDAYRVLTLADAA